MSNVWWVPDVLCVIEPKTLPVIEVEYISHDDASFGYGLNWFEYYSYLSWCVLVGIKL